MRNIILLSIFLCATASAAVTQPSFYARQDYDAKGQVQVADVNGDGIPDVIAVLGYQVTVLLGNGDG